MSSVDFPSSSRAVSRRDDSPLGVALVALALTAVAAAVYFLWLPTAPRNALPAEHYFPLPRGAAFTYRITNSDGAISYRSRNVARETANVGAGSLDSNIFFALAAATGIDVEKMDAAEILGLLARRERANIYDITYDASGRTTDQTQSFFLFQANDLQQFGVGQVGIYPPIPLIPSGNDLHTLELELNDQIPATVTQQVVKRGARATELGEFPDCVQVHATVRVADTISDSLTWYCAGVGEVYDETTDAQGTRKSEIIAASVGAFLRGNAPVSPNAQLNSALRSQFDAPLTFPLKPRLEYQESANSKSITTNILPIENVPLLRAENDSVGSANLLLYGTQSGRLVAVDRASEREVWSFQAGDAIYSTPIVHRGIVYFGAADKKVYAVRVSDGAFVWAFPTQDIVSASPAAQGDTVYIASEDRTLYALDADTGKARWSFTSGSPLVAPPVVAGEMLLASNDDGALYALHAATGQLLWTFAANGAITAPVTVVDGKIYFGAHDQTAYALNQKDGTVLWTQEVGGNIAHAALVHAGRVYVTLPQQIFALDAATGNPVWHYATTGTLYGALVRTGNQLWIFHNSALLALDAADGARLLEMPTTTSSTNAGITSDGRELFVGFFDGLLKSFAETTP